MASGYQIAVSIYVRIIRTTGAILRPLGVLNWLEKRAPDSRRMHWLRSLFAIYDIDGLVALDVPWWTYDAIEEVDAFLKQRPNAKVFEFGSGASSVWLAKRAGSVTSVDHDADWYPVVEARLADFPHSTLLSVTRDASAAPDSLYHSQKQGQEGDSFLAYASTIDATDDMYDVIVIDGRARQACLKHALPHLAPDGLIVFDNTKRARYRAAIDASGLSVRYLPGLTPSLPQPDETALLTHPAG